MKKIFNTDNRRLTTDSRSGQSLVMILVFMVIAVTISTAAVTILIGTSRNVTTFEGGEAVYVASESGIENALLRLLRNPNYTGETMTVDGATVVTTVTGSSPKIITSVTTKNNFKRTLQVQVVNTAGILTISSWTELP